MIDPRLFEAGFALADLARWSRFVATGELARTLIHACLLVKPRLALGFTLTAADDRLVLSITIDGAAGREVPISEPAVDAGPLETLAAILCAINDAIVDAGHVEQLVIVEPPRQPDRPRYRIVFVAPGELLANHELDGVAELCLSARTSARPASASTPVSPVSPVSLLSLASVDARLDRRFDEDGSLIGLVCAYAERLARFAGLEGVTCEPRWTQEPGELTLTVRRAVGRGGLRLTSRVYHQPELDVQPLLDTLNLLLRETEGTKRLYRVARAPERLDVALLDKPAAHELRRNGDLIEHPAKDAFRTFANAGFELPALSGLWRHATSDLRTTLDRLTVLVADAFVLATTVTTDADEVTIAWRVNDRTATTQYPAALAAESTRTVLPRVLCDLNALVGAAGCDQRCIVMTGEPYFHAHRMLVLDRDWLARVAWCREILPGCLDDDTRAKLAHVVGTYPAMELRPPPRLPRIDEIVSRDNIHDNDFKCSARPSDFIELIEGIATFARVALEVDHDIGRDGELFVVSVSYRGAPHAIRLEDTKYVNVAPILDYLNGLLDARRPHHQLYYARMGSYSAGIVRATDAETVRLRLLGYVS